MKKTLVSIVLVMVAVAAAQDAAPQQQTQPTAPQQQPQSSAPQQPSAQPPTGQGTTPTGQTPPSSTGQAPAGQAPAGQAPAAPVAPQQKKEIKDPAEYNAYVGAVQQTDPRAKVNALESFLQQFPNSVMKVDALEQLMAAYEQTNNSAKMSEAANRLLQADPNNLRALALLAYSKRRAAESNQNPQQNLSEAAQAGEHGLQALQSAAKPEGMSDTDFQKLKTQTSVIFNGVVGLNALQNKDYPKAQQHLRAAVEGNPNNLNDVYPLALSYFPPAPPKNPNQPNAPPPPPNPNEVEGLYSVARAANLAAGSPAQAQIADFGKKRYTKYHGSDQGWNELVATAKTTPLPPQGFTIAAAPPPPTPAQQAANLVAKTPAKQMSFAEWELVLSSGNQEAANTVWNAIKGVPLQVQAQVLKASPSRLELAASVDDIDAKRTDIILQMAAPIPARLMPKEGTTIPVEGIPVSYEPNPFVMTMTKGVLLRTAAPKKAAPKKGARRTTSSQ